ncbi:hypothetical protein GCM10023148_57360 [Actinokineospora soli]
MSASTGGVDTGLALDSDALSIDGDLALATSGVAGGADLAVAGVELPELTAPQLGGLDDVTGLLDVDALRAGDVTVGAVANFVTAGGDLSAADIPALGGVLPTVTEDLPVDLPAVPALPAVPELGDLPTDLPVELPELGELPVDLPVDVPSVGDLPVEVPELGDLPVQLPELGDLPVELPELPVDLPVANPLPELGALPQTAGELVSDTPLGQVAGDGGLLDVGGVTDTLGLDG